MGGMRQKKKEKSDGTRVDFFLPLHSIPYTFFSRFLALCFYAVATVNASAVAAALDSYVYIFIYILLIFYLFMTDNML